MTPQQQQELQLQLLERMQQDQFRNEQRFNEMNRQNQNLLRPPC